MRKLATILVVLTLLGAGAAYAQDEQPAENDMQAGFRLGKFYTSTVMLASDLEIMRSLGDTFKPETITDENYNAGTISDEDVSGAQMFLTYALWRSQFLIGPVCQAGLDDGSFVDASLAPFKDETQAVLTDLLADVNAFVDGSDFVALAAFIDATTKADYAGQLFDLADRAQAAAGVESDMPAAAMEEEVPVEEPVPTPESEG